MAKGSDDSSIESNFQLVQKDENIVKVKATRNGDELYATLDKRTHEITMEAIEKPNNLKRLFNKSATNHTSYIVDYENLNPYEDIVDVVIINTSTKEERIFSSDIVKAQLPLLVPLVTWGGRALLLYLLEHALALTFAASLCSK